MMSTRTRTGLQILAVEAVLLRPSRATASAEELRLWPILAIVLDQGRASDPRARALFDLMDRRGLAGFAAADCRWSVRDESTAILDLAVRTTSPLDVDVDVVLPARSLLDHPDLGSVRTVALTNRRKARRLLPGVSLREAMNDLVLVGGMPSELTDLTAERHRRGATLQLVS